MLTLLKSSVISLTIFLFPLFFLPITHEFYATNKLMLLLCASLILVAISLLQFLQSKKLAWSKWSLLSLRPILTFLMVVSIATLVRSPNIVQSSLDHVLGFISLLTLTVFYWYVAGEDHERTRSTHHLLFTFSGLTVSVVTIFFSMNPFKNASLPETFQFLKNQSFTPLGDFKDLTVFLGFIFLYQILTLVWRRTERKRLNLRALFSLGVMLVALVIALYSLFAIKPQLNNAAPLDISVRATLKSLSSPIGFFLGSGVDLFGTLVTQVKNASYLKTPYWQTNSFDLASSGVLHVLAELGVLGFLGLGWIFFSAFRLGSKHSSFQRHVLIFLLAYLGLVFLISPPSLLTFFLLFITLGFFASDPTQKVTTQERSVPKNTLTILLPTLTVITVTLLISIMYGFTRVYRAEIAMRNSIEAVAYNDLNKLYNEQRQAVILNPYIERYRLNFSQTNLFIAKQLAAQSSPDQTLVARSVQAAINEAQAAVALNPQRASNWENLGMIYKNVLGVKDADKWSISSYQRAILLDPQNVSYRIGLGGVYYSLAQYENAVRTFNEAVLMKPDLPNSYYNLAHSYYQNKNAQKAVEVMDVLLSLLKEESSPEYQKVLKERNDFEANTAVMEAPSVIQ